MERLPGLHSQLMGEFQTLLSFPLCATYVSCTSLLELMTINMFAICHTGTTGDVFFFVFLFFFAASEAAVHKLSGDVSTHPSCRPKSDPKAAPTQTLT